LFKKVLIANRGEIAVRIARTLTDLGLTPVAVYTDVDRGSLHVRHCREAHGLGANARAYLDAEQLVAIATRAGCEALHPGYGFLSENPELAELCTARGVTFIGPSAASIRAMGQKQRARATMAAAGVPVVPGGSALTDEDARATADRIGYPVMVKAVDGGGGKGMRLVNSAAELATALERTRSEAEKAFGSGEVYIERALFGARHVEVQVLGDRHGNVVHLGERDCSLQRRHQKVLEETPCPALDQTTRESLCEVALRGARALAYESAGTFEFLLEPSGNFYFLEMNTRLQVEHPVTELVTGVDLVREMVRIAAGHPLDPVPIARGAAIEVRLCAEDPARGFAPSPGRIERLRPPEGPGIRHDAGIAEGTEVSSHYDPLLAKLAAWGPDRAQALARLGRALDEYLLAGSTTNLAFLRRLVRHPDVARGSYDTRFVERHLAELVGEGALAPAERQALAIAAAVAAARTEDDSALGGAASANALSPWVLVERTTRFER
jgi:acetyl-CoA carboxylase, biotin carboxylase subunit